MAYHSLNVIPKFVLNEVPNDFRLVFEIEFVK